jgi:hypothetical protein
LQRIDQGWIVGDVRSSVRTLRELLLLFWFFVPFLALFSEL